MGKVFKISTNRLGGDGLSIESTNNEPPLLEHPGDGIFGKVMNHDAFVSYASKDRAVAFQMVDYLESCGIRCWVAPRDVPGGRNYAEAILSALVESKLFLLIFSENSNGSEHVQREVERALHLSKPIVPVRIKDVLPSGAMDYYLATLHWIDAFAPGSDACDALSELSLEDAAHAAGALIGRNDEVREAVVDIHRKREETERRRIEAEREARLQAEAEAKATIEAEADAKRRKLEEEQKRDRDAALERQRNQDAIEATKRRKLEAKQREKKRRKRETERAGWQRREAHEKAIEEAETRAAAAVAAEAARLVTVVNAPAPATATGSEPSPPFGASTKQRLTIATALVVLLVGIGVWAKGYFSLPEHESAKKAPLVSQPAENLPVTNDPGPEPPSIARLKAHFEWAGERYAVAHSEVLLLSAANGKSLGGTKRKGEVLEIVLPDPDDEFDTKATLAIPGFEPIQKSAPIAKGEVNIDFGSLTRRTGRLRVRSDYADQPRASEAHQPFLKMLRLDWLGSAIDPGSELAKNASAVDWVGELQRAWVPGDWKGSPTAGEEITAKLPTGRYRVVLVTDCAAPFDKISLADVKVSDTSETPPQVSVPIVPLGVFGGDTAWTSTTTEAGRDEDGTVAWTLYNLPVSSDFADNRPRLLQSYTDIVSEGQLLRKYYLPAPITEVAFDPEQRRWHLLVDPTGVVSGLDDDDLIDRYFEKIGFYLRYHNDKRGILFDAETVDQPLNATEGTTREFTLQNAYPDFGEKIPKLATRYPGFGVLDLNEVYTYLAAFNKDNADAYQRSTTTPASMQTPVPITLGIKPDLDFAGSGNVRLKEIVSGGPGEAAGLKAGDLVVSLGGAPVEGIQDFYRIHFGLGVGIATEVQILRGGESRTLVITPKASE